MESATMEPVSVTTGGAVLTAPFAHVPTSVAGTASARVENAIAMKNTQERTALRSAVRRTAASEANA